MNDCTPFNMNRVRQLLDCATEEEMNCMTKLLSYSIVLHAIETVRKQKGKLTKEEKEGKILAEILHTVCVLSNEASLEITGKPLFPEDRENGGISDGKE